MRTVYDCDSNEAIELLPGRASSGRYRTAHAGDGLFNPPLNIAQHISTKARLAPDYISHKHTSQLYLLARSAQPAVMQQLHHPVGAESESSVATSAAAARHFTRLQAFIRPDQLELQAAAGTLYHRPDTAKRYACPRYDRKHGSKTSMIISSC